MKKSRRFYAAYNPYGVHLTYGSIGWSVYAFSSKAGRDAYIEDNCYDRTGNVVCEAITKKEIKDITNGRYILKFLDDGVAEMREEYGYIGYVSDEWHGIVPSRYAEQL